MVVVFLSASASASIALLTPYVYPRTEIDARPESTGRALF